MIRQLPISVNGARKWDVRTQFAALCFARKSGKLRVLLVTSRNNGRWIVPKGWPIDGKTPAQSAAQEAWEEAGVQGAAIDMCLGLFSYRKMRENAEDLPCVAMVYPVRVSHLARSYPEEGQRKRRWVSRKKASQMVKEPELARILRDFDPRFPRGGA